MTAADIATEERRRAVAFAALVTGAVAMGASVLFVRTDLQPTVRLLLHSSVA